MVTGDSYYKQIDIVVANNQEINALFSPYFGLPSGVLSVPSPATYTATVGDLLYIDGSGFSFNYGENQLEFVGTSDPNDDVDATPYVALDLIEDNRLAFVVPDGVVDGDITLTVGGTTVTAGTYTGTGVGVPPEPFELPNFICQRSGFYDIHEVLPTDVLATYTTVNITNSVIDSRFNSFQSSQVDLGDLVFPPIRSPEGDRWLLNSDAITSVFGSTSIEVNRLFEPSPGDIIPAGVMLVTVYQAPRIQFFASKR